MLPMAVARRGDEISRGMGIFPIDNTLYSIAFGTHAKTAELIEMPFWMMSRLTRETVCYVGVTISKGEGAFWGKNICPTSLTLYEL